MNKMSGGYMQAVELVSHSSKTDNSQVWYDELALLSKAGKKLRLKTINGQLKNIFKRAENTDDVEKCKKFQEKKYLFPL